MQPLFFIGYMASGKTTFGKALAKKLNRKFIDLDEYIEEKYQCTVSQIFKEKGEKEFREIESESLKEVSILEDAVISCGGGTPCFNNNMEYINRHGISVFLEADTEVLKRRLIEGGTSRPLVAGKSEKELENTIVEQLQKRLQYYKQAHIRWDSSHLESEEEIATSVSNFLEKFLQTSDVFSNFV